MHVSATRPVPAGQQLVLSYGERASDDFFIHYGFVPPLCNPHEVRVVCACVRAFCTCFFVCVRFMAVMGRALRAYLQDAVVFEDLEEALEWHHEQFGGQVRPVCSLACRPGCVSNNRCHGSQLHHAKLRRGVSLADMWVRAQ